MMDKVQKIREEVEKLFNHVKDSNFESDSGAFYYLKDLLDFIDSLQEESVSNLWLFVLHILILLPPSNPNGNP